MSRVRARPTLRQSSSLLPRVAMGQRSALRYGSYDEQAEEPVQAEAPEQIPKTGSELNPS